MLDRDAIIGVLREFMEKEVCYELSELAEAIEEAIRPSFSEQIIENNCVKRKCSQGHWHSIYRLNFRKTHVPSLRVLAKYPQTNAEIAAHFTGTLSRSIGKYLSEAIHFGVVELAGRRRGQPLYRITQLGLDFLSGAAMVPSHVWPKNAPEECTDGSLISIHDIPEVDHADKVMHANQSIPL